jgi:hypothetical protein
MQFEGTMIDVYAFPITAPTGDTEALCHFTGRKWYSGMTRIHVRNCWKDIGLDPESQRCFIEYRTIDFTYMTVVVNLVFV